MLSRDYIKTALQRAGVFPVARSIYRKLSPEIRKQHLRELLFYGDIIPQKSLCFDIGANLGQRSRVFVELGSRVVAVEPNENCLATLRYEFSANEKVSIVPKAIGPKEGYTTFFAHGTDSTASVDPAWDQKLYGFDRGHDVKTVPMTTLDLLINRFGTPHFIKIDVEGFEIEVLKGLSKAIPVISFEFHRDSIANAIACLDRLASIAPISIRAASMECEWLTDRLDNQSDFLPAIRQLESSGDIFVWSDH